MTYTCTHPIYSSHVLRTSLIMPHTTVGCVTLSRSHTRTRVVVIHLTQNCASFCSCCVWECGDYQIKMTAKNIIYRKAVPSDRDKILSFIREHFYPEEPVNIGREPLQQTLEDEEFSLSTIEHGTSILAIDYDTKNIAGAMLSSPMVPGDAEKIIEEATRCSNKKWSDILLLLAHLEQKANVCERYNVKRALLMNVLSVDKHMRGHSIGVNMMHKCMELGKQMSYAVARIDCTSAYSIRIAEKLNMECVSEMAYADYRDDMGEQIVNIR